MKMFPSQIEDHQGMVLGECGMPYLLQPQIHHQPISLIPHVGQEFEREVLQLLPGQQEFHIVEQVKLEL